MARPAPAGRVFNGRCQGSLVVRVLVSLLLVAICSPSPGATEDVLSNTLPLTVSPNTGLEMVDGIHRFLVRETDRSIAGRASFWHRDFSSAEAYTESVRTNRDRLRLLIGAVDSRSPVSVLVPVENSAVPFQIITNDLFTVQAVRWAALRGVFAEGLWLRPRTNPVARVVAIPDADQTPEIIVGLAPGLAPERQFARRLAESGCEVLVPALIDRRDEWSGNANLKRFTNQPHREWIYRQAFELGRHIVGYEVQKVLAAVDWFVQETSATNGAASLPSAGPRIGVVGYAEGGLIAMYAAALDSRIGAAFISGYFDSRQGLWTEPIYRNLQGLLTEFGDAEIATLIAPRALVVEHSLGPTVNGPPKPHDGRSGAAPGKLGAADYQSVENEFERARTLLAKGDPKIFDRLTLICGTEGMPTGPVSDRAMTAFLNLLGSRIEVLNPPQPLMNDQTSLTNLAARQQRQVVELVEFTQAVFREAESNRNTTFWNKADVASADEWSKVVAPSKRSLWEDVIGRVPYPAVPLNARSRKILDRTKWTGYEVKLDVWQDVFAWGYLLLPKDLKPGERRPVVVCQHGLEGGPADVVNEDTSTQSYRYYKAFAARLADRGFVVFAPQNPYLGEDRFRTLQRLANPLGKSLFSFIIAQHNRILDWLSDQPFVEPQRIGFYGLSYGGKTAMRVPSVLDRYALSICSGDFNEWIRKNVSVDFSISYMFTGEYEMPEFNLGNTFNYAEMAALIAPRPFMVERGHSDGVGLDEWVAGEYEKVRKFYDRLGISDRTRIEFFDGPHTINGVGTFEFLHRCLDWPAQ